MNPTDEVPEISQACWGVLGVDPRDIMCASSRMVVKRRDADRPTVVSCTLLPYEPEFELGETLRAAAAPIRLNHPPLRAVLRARRRVLQLTGFSFLFSTLWRKKGGAERALDLAPASP